mmetsp:Transcript_135524/g.433525  ORF Transcript_135524/g.433525 Transcript_135524/m.433525 type:complete len:221 (+) Transcript_135524:369-1031(+)
MARRSSLRLRSSSSARNFTSFSRSASFSKARFLRSGTMSMHLRSAWATGISWALKCNRDWSASSSSDAAEESPPPPSSSTLAFRCRRCPPCFFEPCSRASSSFRCACASTLVRLIARLISLSAVMRSRVCKPFSRFFTVAQSEGADESSSFFSSSDENSKLEVDELEEPPSSPSSLSLAPLHCASLLSFLEEPKEEPSGRRKLSPYSLQRPRSSFRLFFA